MHSSVPASASNAQCRTPAGLPQQQAQIRSSNRAEVSPHSNLVSSKRVKLVSINTVILEVDIFRTLSGLAAGTLVFVSLTVFKLAAVATTETPSAVRFEDQKIEPSSSSPVIVLASEAKNS